jgi:multiple sugar transport system permease protein
MNTRKVIHQKLYSKTPYIMLIPVIGIALVVSIYPILHAFIVSLYKTSYLKLTEYVGLKNYLVILADPEVQHSILVSLKYVLGTLCVSVLLGLGLALILSKPIRFNGIFRAILVIPYVVSQVAAAVLWMWFLNPEYGPINYLIRQLGIGPVMFLQSPKLALPTMIIVNSWMSFPFAMILLLAAIESIPKDIYEAAHLDGASQWNTFRYITFPLILSTLGIAAIMISLRTLNMVSLILTLTGGGPLNITHTLGFRIYHDAFVSFRVGRACALGVIMFLLNILFGTAYVRVIKEETIY